MAGNKSQRKSINMRLNLRKKSSAFSIIEIMAVVFIVAIGMIGMMNLIGQSIRVQRLNEHTLIAYQLAQEGIELVRVIRDNNWLSASPTSFSATLIPGSYCIDYSNVVLGENTASACDLYLNNNNFYIHQSADNIQTPYSRLIRIEEHEANYAVNVIVKIIWEDVSGDFEYEVETRLYDWH